MKYYPKGSMCAGCSKQKDDCSSLPFKDMRVIESVKEINVVVCTHFERLEKKCDKTVDMFGE